jgi:hypothetical protein
MHGQKNIKVNDKVLSGDEKEALMSSGVANWDCLGCELAIPGQASLYEHKTLNNSEGCNESEPKLLNYEIHQRSWKYYGNSKVHFFHWTALMKITTVCSDGDLCLWQDLTVLTQCSFLDGSLPMLPRSNIFCHQLTKPVWCSPRKFVSLQNDKIRHRQAS